MEAGRARPPCGCRHAWPRGGTPRSWICPGRAGDGRTVLPCLPSARSLIIAKLTVHPQGQHRDRHHRRGAPFLKVALDYKADLGEPANDNRRGHKPSRIA